ncbi:hypothetical protein Sste5346_006154 [Sporothrix stenoceras]|uniref:DUF7357 domain-containing protein n=1 Tax=Sporothrix stenoceras TaxID=5173 RepID=A0ABR3Z1E6_9PEZI
MADRPLRLRLHIQRNGLPDTRIVFLLPTTDDTTVTKLLEQVNELVPLESDDWGLDDYVVEVASTTDRSAFFECLHYQLVSNLLDRDSEVFIRPLSSDELKKRRISGRHQISVDGRRLVDGVPFGRPLLKRPRGRPPVEIVPRKRRRPIGSGFEEEEDYDEMYDEEDEEEEVRRQLIEYLPDEEGDNEEGDEDDEEDEEEEVDSDEEMDADLDEDELQGLRDEAASTTNPSRRVRFATSKTTKTKTTTAAADDDDSSDDGDFDGAGSSSDSSDSDADSSDSDSDSDDAPLEISSKPSSTDADVPPHQGKARTKRRNARRRAKQAEKRALRQAKQELAERVEQTVTTAETTADTAVESPASLGRRLRLDMGAGRRLIASALGLRGKATQQPQPTKVETTTTTTTSTETTTTTTTPPPPGHPDHWASRINYTAVECSEDNFVLDKPTFPFVQQWHNNNKKGGKNQQQQAKAGAKRKQDTAAADEPRPKKRAAPESESDTSSSDSSSSESSSDDDSSDDDSSSDGGKTTKKIGLSLMADWGGSDSDSNDSEFNGGATPDSSSESEENDEEEEDETRGEPQTSEETLHAEAEAEAETAPADEELPPLPADIASLPLLTAGAATEGMIITWKNWVLSEKTSWQPQVTDVMSRVVGVDDDGATLRVVLAHRDRDLGRKPEKQYDEETGERVYGRFDGPDMEEDESDEEAEVDSGHRSLALAELMEPRIVQAVETPEEAVATE